MPADRYKGERKAKDSHQNGHNGHSGSRAELPQSYIYHKQQ